MSADALQVHLMMGRAGRPRPYRHFLIVALGLILIACQGNEARSGSVRLVDAWQKRHGPSSERPFLTLRSLTRSGIPLYRAGRPERFELRVPQAAHLTGILGIGLEGAGEIQESVHVELVVSSCGPPGEPGGAEFIARIEFDGVGWHPIDFDLSDFAGRELDLCMGASATAPASLLLADARVATPGDVAWPPNRPNLLVITVDTTRGDHLGSAGYDRDTSPFLDALAAEGEQYLNALTNSSWTLPTHASLFTGRHPREHGARSHVLGSHSLLWNFFGLPMQELTVAEQLSAVGYRTGAFVAGTMVSAEFGFAQGFDLYDQPRTREPDSSLEAEVFTERSGEEVTDLALEWIEDRRRPFFLFLNYFDPHWPYVPPADLADRWVDAGDPAIDIEGYPAIWREVMTGQRALSQGERRTMVALYDAEIRAMDRAIGRLLAGLRAGGDYEDTMIVVVSDHGEAFGEHTTLDHGVTLYEEQLKAVLIVKYPGADPAYPAGHRFDHRVDLIDLHATIQREMGLVSGSDHSAATEEDAEKPMGIASYGLHKKRRVHFAELNRNLWMMGSYGPRFDRDLEATYRDQYKLIRTDRGVVELYDLDSDPGETRDLAASEPEIVLELEAELDAFGEAVPWQSQRGDGVSLSPGLAEQLEALGYGRRGRSAD